MRNINRYAVPAAATVVGVGIGAYLAAQNTWLDVEHIRIDLPEEFSGTEILKIAHISDMHLPKTVSRIEKMTKKIAGEKPDIIVVTGDIIDYRSDIDTSGLAKFCRCLRQIAPVYAVTGNHEYRNGNVQDWKNVLYQNGVVIADDSFYIFEKNDCRFAIMGLSNGMPYDINIFEHIENIGSMPRILLAHHPELFKTYSSQLDEIKPHVVFAGHTHGGQVRLPKIGGVVAPGQGLFPKYTGGIYMSKSGVKMIVSRGIGNSKFPFRINDRPHIPIVSVACGTQIDCSEH